MNLKQNSIKVLGYSGSKDGNHPTTAFLITKDIAVDAGNIIAPLKERASEIDHLFVTHAHFDHIVDFPFLVESFFELKKNTLHVYGTTPTITLLQKHIFNDKIWPDFSKIKLLNGKVALVFHQIECYKSYEVNGCRMKAIPMNHIKGSCGYVIEKDSRAIFIASDTYKNDMIWDEINTNKAITTLLIECSFPSTEDELAKVTKHLTPSLLKEELKKLSRDIDIYIYHMKPSFHDRIVQELLKLKLIAKDQIILEERTIVY